MTKDAGARDGELLTLVKRLSGHVLAVGDLMLDIFAYGTVNRISPEAPVPVIRMIQELAMEGGVGNVARNVAALRGRSTLIAPVGIDDAAQRLRGLLSKESGVVPKLVSNERPTAVKTRYVAAGQQILRVDREELKPLDLETEAQIVSTVEAEAPKHQAIILSDYGKGALSTAVIAAAMDACRLYNVPVFVDPKNKDFSVYRGATCITPNLAELSEATGSPVSTNDEVVSACRLILTQTDAAHVLATRSQDGMSLVSANGDCMHLPARRREVFDVSGAGDTVIATLALAVASGSDWAQAAALANVAAGVVVSKQGTSTCTRDEIEHELAGHLLANGSKLQSRTIAMEMSARWANLGLIVGFTNGCFDLLHPGHTQILQRARARCDRLIVGLNSDASVRRQKGPTRPVQSQEARATVLAALAAVDLIIVFDEDTPQDLIAAIRPQVLVKGADYTLDDVVGADLVLANGGKVFLEELVHGQSTTSIIRRSKG